MPVTAQEIVTAFNAAGFADEQQLTDALTVLRLESELSELQAQLNRLNSFEASKREDIEANRQTLQGQINAKQAAIDALQPTPNP